LLSYVRPYSFRLAVGVVLVAFVALAEGMVAFMARIAWDFVLTPPAASSQLPLFTIPGGRVVFLNEFFPARIHNPWTVFSLTLLALFVSKGVAEYFGLTLIHSAAHAAIPNLRNQVWARIIRQPMGFFQHHPAGRILSAVI